MSMMHQGIRTTELAVLLRVTFEGRENKLRAMSIFVFFGGENLVEYFLHSVMIRKLVKLKNYSVSSTGESISPTHHFLLCCLHSGTDRHRRCHM